MEASERNRKFRESMIAFAETVERARQDVLFDPQTSGGLLIAVRSHQGDELVRALREAGIADASEIGEVIEGPDEIIRVE
jgi:selenide,water dikinase